MSNRARLVVLVIIALVGASLAAPVSAGDIVIEYSKPQGPSGCTGREYYEYTATKASWVVYFTRGRDGCDYRGELTVTATLYREVTGNSGWTTATAVTICPALEDCEARVSRDHPSIEGKSYAMEWSFWGDDHSHGGWPWYWEWRSGAAFCESYVVIAHCGPLRYMIIHAPGP